MPLQLAPPPEVAEGDGDVLVLENDGGGTLVALQDGEWVFEGSVVGEEEPLVVTGNVPLVVDGDEEVPVPVVVVVVVVVGEVLDVGGAD